MNFELKNSQIVNLKERNKEGQLSFSGKCHVDRLFTGKLAVYPVLNWKQGYFYKVFADKEELLKVFEIIENEEITANQ